MNYQNYYQAPTKTMGEVVMREALEIRQIKKSCKIDNGVLVLREYKGEQYSDTEKEEMTQIFNAQLNTTEYDLFNRSTKIIKNKMTIIKLGDEVITLINSL